jgi:hypothetical protein
MTRAAHNGPSHPLVPGRCEVGAQMTAGEVGNVAPALASILYWAT